MGGLGNQLFQYAAGRSLAMKRGVELLLDLSFLNSDAGDKHTRRQLEIDLFNTSYLLSSAKDLEKFTSPDIFKRFVARIMGNTELVNEKGFEFDPHFFSYPRNTYLNGFWQSEKYFGHIRGTLLKEFAVKNSVPERCREIAEAMNSSNSVSLHIRRGDYVSNKNASEFHGVLPLDYYYNAITYLKQKTGASLNVFIFSDEMDWVKENLQTTEDLTYIDFNKNENSVYDLYLMTQCRHNIIANSSFSWWGAWLNQHPGKIVIAPKQWFKSADLNTKDLIPAEWVRL